MPAPPKGETLEQKKERYLQSGYNQAKTRKQNLNPDGTLKVTEDDLWQMAYRYMEKQLEREAQSGRVKQEQAARYNQQDEEWRQQQAKRYRSDYEWNTSNDESALDHLLGLEVQMRQIERELEAATSPAEKQALRKSQTDSSREHRQLMVALGIDRLNREKKSDAGDPMTDWNRIKEEALLKKQIQKEHFISEVESVTTEAQLRDIIKYGLLMRFDVIDPLLANHRRVLGLPVEVEKS